MVRRTELIGHSPFGPDHLPGLLGGQQRLEIGVNLRCIVRKPFFEFHLVRVGGTTNSDLDIVREMKRVIDRSDRAKLDGPAAQPVKNATGKLIGSKRAAIMQANIPGETIPAE